VNGRGQRAVGGNGATVLVIEDDRSLREGLAMNLSLQGYRVLDARSGEEGLATALASRPDLIVLDIMLPGRSGLDILIELREHREDVPVLILSARGGTGHKVKGLRLGADDYVAKPFELSEFLARVEALLRRRRPRGPDDAPPIRVGDVELDPVRRRVLVAGAEVSLSAKEFDLLHLLARSPGRPYTREQILEQVWGWDFEGTSRTVDNFILALRHKIERDPAHPRHIKTVRHVGYKLEA